MALTKRGVANLALIISLVVLTLLVPVSVRLTQQEQRVRLEAEELNTYLVCNSLTLSAPQINVGTPVTVSVQASPYYLVRYARVQDKTRRCSQGDCQTLIGNTFTPTMEGIYVFEVNVYDSQTCHYLCSAGQHLYYHPEGNRCVGPGWQLVDNCQSSSLPLCQYCQNGPQCLVYLEVTAALPTPTLTITPTPTTPPTLTPTPTFKPTATPTTVTPTPSPTVTPTPTYTPFIPTDPQVNPNCRTTFEVD